MCGRATLSTPPEDLREFFDLDEMPELRCRYNIAPTQPIAVLREPHRLELLLWGLVSGNSNLNTGARGINVRAESVARAPAYRDSFRKRRCLVIVDGFYEWQHLGKTKQPFLVRRSDRKPFALAGIWADAISDVGEVIESCAVITGDAKGVVAELHDRMPIVVPAASYARWLDPNARDVSDLLTSGADALLAYPVSTLVNSPDNDDARCVETVDLPLETLPLFGHAIR